MRYPPTVRYAVQPPGHHDISSLDTGEPGHVRRDIVSILHSLLTTLRHALVWIAQRQSRRILPTEADLTKASTPPERILDHVLHLGLDAHLLQHLSIDSLKQLSKQSEHGPWLRRYDRDGWVPEVHPRHHTPDHHIEQVDGHDVLSPLSPVVLTPPKPLGLIGVLLSECDTILDLLNPVANVWLALIVSIATC